MKALSILQPWATLIAIGAKTIETRSWATKYRGPLAIHASKGWPKKIEDVRFIDPFFKVLMEAGYRFSDQFPRGAVIATCRLVDCLYIGPTYMSLYRNGKPCGKYAPLPKGNELAFGDYTSGRYALILEDVKPLPEPIPAKGMLGLWEWDGNV